MFLLSFSVYVLMYIYVFCILRVFVLLAKHFVHVKAPRIITIWIMALYKYFIIIIIIII